MKIHKVMTNAGNTECTDCSLCERVRGSRAQMEGCGFVAFALPQTPLLIIVLSSFVLYLK